MPCTHRNRQFGWVLRLLRQRLTNAKETEQLLSRTLGELEKMARHERVRRLELITFIDAMIHHERGPRDHQRFSQMIVDSVKTDPSARLESHGIQATRLEQQHSWWAIDETSFWNTTGDHMDREMLMAAVRLGPVEVSMNDGQKLTIPGVEFCVVDDIAAHILYRAEDGSWKTKIAALVCMATFTTIQSTTSNEPSVD